MKLQFKKIMYLPLVLIGLIMLTAGHHFETKLAQKYPALDTEDIFVFESENKKEFLDGVKKISSNEEHYKELQEGCKNLAKTFDRKKSLL